MLFLGAASSMPVHAADEGHALALIGVSKRDSGIEIVGSALALSAGSFSGEMTVAREGAGGTVQTRQGRKFDLAAGESADIARISLSYAAGDKVRVTITLSRNGSVIAETSLNTIQQ